MAIQSLILGLMAETSIHAGASSANHVIDLPIMREHSTGWPVVFGSAVKGAMRAKARNINVEKQLRITLFGPEIGKASDHAGSLLISDARLLLLPVRSLTTQFRYVTSPNLIQRWLRDQERAGVAANTVKLPTIKANEALVAQSTSDLFLEEFVYETQSAELDDLVAALAEISGRTVDEIKEKLTIVNDDQFALLCRGAVPVNAHIAIENTTKTVRPGALWYEESLPAETLLYTVVAAQSSRNPKLPKPAESLLEDLKNHVFSTPYLQLGGNETTGMGWCKVQVQQGGAA